MNSSTLAKILPKVTDRWCHVKGKKHYFLNIITIIIIISIITIIIIIIIIILSYNIIMIW